MAPNVFLLAADNSPELLPILQETPSLASSQDEHGYSLIHAAASYNHLDLLRRLVQDFNVDVNIKDEDDETALFVVETVDAAKVLVEELDIDFKHRGADGATALERIETENEFPEVALYLRLKLGISTSLPLAGDSSSALSLPQGMKVTVGTMNEETDIPTEVDEGYRRRIEELAQRDDFHSEQGQADLRALVEEALAGEHQSTDERNVRSRLE